MPMVGKKKFPYTAKGKAKAKETRRKNKELKTISKYSTLQILSSSSINIIERETEIL